MRTPVSNPGSEPARAAARTSASAPAAAPPGPAAPAPAANAHGNGANLAFGEMLDSVPGAWFFTRRDGSFAYVSLGACEALGYSRRELLSARVFDIDPTFDADSWSKLWESTAPHQSKITRTVHRRRDGSEYPIEIRSLKIELDGEHLSASYSVDLTVAEQTRAALQATESRLQRLIGNLPDLVFRLRLEPRPSFEFVSMSCQTLLGYASAELERDEQAVARIVHPLDLARFLALEGAEPGRGSRIRFLHRSGRVVWMDLRASLLDSGAEQPRSLEGVARDVTESQQAELANRRLLAAMEQAAEAVVVTDAQGRVEYVNPAYQSTSGLSERQALGKPWRELEVRNDRAFLRRLDRVFERGEVWQGRIHSTRADGVAYAEDGTVAPIRDEAGQRVGCVAVKRDITEQLQLEEQLQTARRLETVAQLAAGIAHDFNNLLHVIQGHTQMMQLLDLQGFSAAKDLTEMLREVDKATARAAVLVRQLLTFRRTNDDTEFTELELDQVLRSFQGPLEKLLGSHIQLVFTCDGGPVRVRGSRAQLEQMVTNLCLNARDALPPGGYLYLTLDGTAPGDLPSVLKGNTGEAYLRLSVRDDGAGMTREVQQRLYEPFFTTKRPGEGVGLGLATVYAIVQSHHGFIDATSARGKGSTFRIYLPRTDRSAPISAPPGSQRVDGRGRIVLVAEDEPAVSQLTSCFLREAGFEVLLATSGPEAARQLRERGPEIAIAVLDAVMPGFGGAGVLSAMKELGLSAPVVFITGYDYPALQGAGGDEQVAILRKPFGSEELLEHVGRLLGELT